MQGFRIQTDVGLINRLHLQDRSKPTAISGNRLLSVDMYPNGAEALPDTHKDQDLVLSNHWNIAPEYSGKNIVDIPFHTEQRSYRFEIPQPGDPMNALESVFRKSVPLFTPVAFG